MLTKGCIRQQSASLLLSINKHTGGVWNEEAQYFLNIDIQKLVNVNGTYERGPWDIYGTVSDAR